MVLFNVEGFSIDNLEGWSLSFSSIGLRNRTEKEILKVTRVTNGCHSPFLGAICDLPQEEHKKTPL